MCVIEVFKLAFAIYNLNDIRLKDKIETNLKDVTLGVCAGLVRLVWVGKF